MPFAIQLNCAHLFSALKATVGILMAQRAQRVRIAQPEEEYALPSLDLARQYPFDLFVETDQNGTSRTKGEMIELFRTFKIQSLTTDSFSIRVNLDAAVVTGSQTEINAAATDRMLYTRVWINSGDRWRLVASSQFRDRSSRRLQPANADQRSNRSRWHRRDRSLCAIMPPSQARRTRRASHRRTLSMPPNTASSRPAAKSSGGQLMPIR